MKIALAQCNPVVGDIEGNTARMADCIARSRSAGADLVVFGELSMVGYPPRDLLRKERFIADNLRAVQRLADSCRGIAALVGYVRPTPDGSGRPLQNVAGLLQEGRIAHVHVKTLLPTYDVFDETRYFEPGPPPRGFDLNGTRVGLSICEDLWDAEALGRALYGADPIQLLVQDGAGVIVNMAASPFQVGKPMLREELFRRRARRTGLPVVYVNQVGGNDELVFDGGSCVVGAQGQVLARAARFREDLVVVDLGGHILQGPPEMGDLEQLSAALKLGLRDYIRKCGFKSVVLGLSGGIDSSVVAALAADALGPGNVVGISMPSRYSSDHSRSDAADLAAKLGVVYQTVPIERMHRAFDEALAGPLEGGDRAIADENIQARIRGLVVMAFSNAFGHMALATGNKSELSTGYCTLYGDMSGGLAPIGDVYKTQVFRLAGQLNREAGFERINRAIIDKPPSAELKPNQFDQDKLPPYDLLDAILERYIEGDQTGEQIAAAGFDPAVVRRVVRMVDAAEYKRKQAAPVLKVTARAFGAGRRMPIAQRYLSVGGF